MGKSSNVGGARPFLASLNNLSNNKQIKYIIPTCILKKKVLNTAKDFTKS